MPQSAPPAPAYGQQQPQSAPPYAPPASTPPVSAPPVPGGAGYLPSAPAFGQPMSVPPLSGPAPGQPMSGPPGATPPYGPPGATPPYGPPGATPPYGPPGATPPYGPPASAAAPGRRSVLVLAVVAGLLFVLGGVMTGLYLTKSSELDRTEKRLTGQVSERDGTIAANKSEIEKLKADLQGVRDKLSETEQDLTGTRNDRDEQARQKKVIATCLDKLTSALTAAAANNKAAYDKATQGMDKVCDEAEDYL
ncbi:hypothetical protein MCAG_04497 [Micromonospora sp. ATCC 39149]|nr:hypothetical protein MCAG_04497 [Micromonospora sp. ATCC 39149]